MNPADLWKKAGKVSMDDAGEAAAEGERKVRELDGNRPGPLQGMWDDILNMLALVKDYVSGAHREVPWRTLGGIVVGLLYFILPLDALPDWIPLSGYLDDAAVLAMVRGFVREDLKRYSAWKKGEAPAQAPA